VSVPRALWRRRSDVVAAVAGAAAAGAGGLALLGWALGEPFLTSFGSRNIPMAPSTALLFIVFGAAFLVSAGKSEGTWRRTAAVAGAVFGGAVALGLLVASLRGLRLPVEHLGFRISGTVEGAPVGFMSPFTAGAFLLVGAALAGLLLSRGRLPGLTFPATLAGIVLVTGGGVFVLAYLAGEPLAYGQTFIPPAAPTSAAFVALGLGTLALARSADGSRRAHARLPAGSTAAMLGLFLALAAGIVGTGLTWFKSRDRQFREQIDRQLAAVAELKATELVRWRAERIGDGRVLQGNEAFLRLAHGVLDGTGTGAEAGILAAWLGNIRASYGYEAAQLLDARGAARISLPAGAPPPCRAASDEVADVLASGESRLLDLHRDTDDGPVHMAVLVPLVDGGTGLALGSVLLRIDSSAFLFPFLSHWPFASASAESLLVRREGPDFVYASELRSSPGSALRLRLPVDGPDYAVMRAALGEEEVGPDHGGTPIVATTRPVPGSPWWLLSRVDAAEAFAPLRERLWLTVFLMAGLLLAAGAGVEAVRRRELARLELARRQVEEERASLRDVIERSLNEVYLFDPETFRFRFVNRGAVRNLGYTPDELHAMTPLDLVPGMDAEGLRRLLSDATSRRGEAHRFETIQRRKDGTLYPVEVHLQLVDVAPGPVFLAIVNDITERRAAEDRIRQLNRVYAVLSDVNQSIVRVKDEAALGVEACRIAVQVGGLLEAWIGLREGEGDQLRLLARAPAGSEVSAPDGDEAPYSELARRVLREGTRAVSDAGRDFHGGGAAAPAGALPTAAFPLLVEGAPAGVFLLVASEPGTFDEEELHLLDEMALDLGFALETIRREAARKAAEERLARSEMRFRTVARLSSDFSFSCSGAPGREYVVDWITDAFFSISGYTEAELREKGCWLFVAHPEDREAAAEPLARLRPGEADEQEFRILTRSGDVRWLVNRMECEADPDVPDGLRLYGAVHDVTLSRLAELEVRQLNADLERRVAERTEELAAAVRELETFAYSVSHDLKAPLRAVDGYSQILLDEHASSLNEEAVELLGRLRRGAQRMAQLVEGLLAYSRIERRALQTGPVQIDGVLRAVLVELREEVEAKGADVVVHISRDVVRADRDGLEIILRNLVGNSLKYSRPDRPPRIEIAAREAEGKFLLSVSDDGIGFDVQYHDRIFEIFQRLHRLEDYGGTGIGLALVKKAAERMKGRVWARSEPGQGATFYVELPG
jgi:PAS domain S-box-containing protein